MCNFIIGFCILMYGKSISNSDNQIFYYVSLCHLLVLRIQILKSKMVHTRIQIGWSCLQFGWGRSNYRATMVIFKLIFFFSKIYSKLRGWVIFYFLPNKYMLNNDIHTKFRLGMRLWSKSAPTRSTQTYGSYSTN